MGLSNTTILSIAELLGYMTLIPVTIYLGYRHGKHGFLGWFYLNAFCALRAAADIVQIIDRNQPTNQPSIASAILSSLGLSPLILSASGFLHESHRYHLNATMSKAKVRTSTRWLWFAQFQIHGVSGAGMIFLIIGSVNLVSAKTTSEENHDDKLRSIGAVLIFLLWLGLCQYALWLHFQCRKNATRSQQHHTIITTTLIALPFIGIRSIYSVVYTFDHKSTALNPVTGSFAVKLFLVVLVQLLAAIALIVGGYLARDIADGWYSGLEAVNADELAHDASSDSSYGGRGPKQVLLVNEDNGRERTNWA